MEGPPKRDNPEKVISAFLNPNEEQKGFTLSVSDFKIVYQRLHAENRDNSVDIVLNGDWAIAQFPKICNYRIRIRPDNTYCNIKRFFGIHTFIEKNDFEIAFSNAKFWGQCNRYTFINFLLEEIQTNGLRGLISFIFSVGLLYLATNLIGATGSANSIIGGGASDFLSKINEVMITISAIFLGLFILFTASQNLVTLSSSKFFVGGTSHRFMSVDKYITRMSIFTIWLSAINVALSFSEPILDFKIISIGNFYLEIRIFVILLTAFVITSMLLAMFTVERYYFDRIKYIYETENSRNLLDKELEDNLPEDNLPVDNSERLKQKNNNVS